MFFGRAGGVGMRADAKHRLRAFVALCEIHWRSFWLWRGGVVAREGRGGIPTQWRVNSYFRHAELVSASYFLSAVGSKILKQVQDDGLVSG